MERKYYLMESMCVKSPEKNKELLKINAVCRIRQYHIFENIIKTIFWYISTLIVIIRQFV